MDNKETGKNIRGYIGFREAVDLILSNTKPVKVENAAVFSCSGYVNAEDIVAVADSPTDNIAFKDGYAVMAADIAAASEKSPVKLEITGSVFAGGRMEERMHSGQAVKMCSGGPLPAGADAVVPLEFCEEAGSSVYVKASKGFGRSLVYAAEDVKSGNIIVKKGTVISPAQLSLIAAAGISHIKVYSKPNVRLVAIGDEIIAPGQELSGGRVYASNLVNIGAWLSCYQIKYTVNTAADDIESIRHNIIDMLPETDVIITSGGAFSSERDLVIEALDGLGWKRVFHYVRMGPGKGIAFGLLKDKPVFCLPGGPPSNEMSFLQLALPGILNLSGLPVNPFITVKAKLTEDINGRDIAWTEFKRSRLSYDEDGSLLVTPYYDISRLKLMANSNCIICKPEGTEALRKNDILTAQIALPSIIGLSVLDKEK